MGLGGFKPTHSLALITPSWVMEGPGLSYDNNNSQNILCNQKRTLKVAHLTILQLYSSCSCFYQKYINGNEDLPLFVGLNLLPPKNYSFFTESGKQTLDQILK